MYAIIRTKKHKSIGSLTSRENHTYRKTPTPNADPKRKIQNKVILGHYDYSKATKEFLKNYELAGNKIRKDGVIAIEYLLTTSPEFFDIPNKLERAEKVKEWCEAQVDFMKKEHGESNIVSMVLHMDETTPHIECYVVPLDARGRLNCKHFLGGD